MPFFDPIRIGASGAVADFTVERSLRFNDGDSAYLNRTFGSVGNRKTFTISAWIKLGNINTVKPIFSRYTGNSNAGFLGLYVNSDNYLYFTGWSTVYFQTNRLFRDPSAWYHIVFAMDTTQSTNTDRWKLYINGTQETSFASTSYPSQDADLAINEAVAHMVGRYSTNYFDGYITELNFIDGSALTPSSFGKTDPITGQWIPKKYVGGYGTNGFYLNFSDNSGTTATTLGKDSSGNGNNFTPNNFSVSAGIGNDSLEDTPTNNFCTLNPLDTAAAITTQNGNLQIADSSTGNYNGIRASFGSKTGKYYWEIKFPNTGYISGIGIARADGRIDNGNQPTYRIVLGLGSWFASYNSNNVNSYVNANPSSDYGNWSGASNYSANDVYMIAVDFGAGKIWWGKNGSWFNNSGTADPSTGTDPRHTFTTGNEWFPYSQEGDLSSCNQSYNFGQQGFAYTPPSGFVELSSTNLPDPTILLPNKHFAAFTYTGTGSSGDVVNITNSDVDFTPDWVWVKTRSVSNDHILSDSVRGGTKYLVSSENYAEQTDTDKIRAFIQNGFESGTDGDTNWPSRPFVAWNWNAGETDGKTYAVTVVSDSGNKYRFDGFGTSAVTLDLAEGGTYIFDQSDSSNAGHPLRFYTAADKTGGEYTTGVTTAGTPGSSGAYTQIVVAASAPTLFYQCSVHAGMGGQANTNSTLGSSNFDGSIQSTVKVNATAGFSILTYTGTGSNATIGHGLGVTANAIIVKRRNGTQNWGVYHSSIAPNDILQLDVTNSVYGGSGVFGNALATSSVFSVDAGSGMSNGNGDTYVAYCFSEVAGYSKFGSYTGNGSNDGTFIYTGFRPAFVLLKSSNLNVGWYLLDNKRDPDNFVSRYLRADTSADEDNDEFVDFLANGFKQRYSDTSGNGNGDSYIYLAFAESPFKNARAR